MPYDSSVVTFYEVCEIPQVFLLETISNSDINNLTGFVYHEDFYIENILSYTPFIVVLSGLKLDGHEYKHQK